MSALVLGAELGAIAFLFVFCLTLASDGIRGPVFGISSGDPVGRTLIRSVQAAFAAGYSFFFVTSIVQALHGQ
jgi:hypothetical protein